MILNEAIDRFGLSDHAVITRHDRHMTIRCGRYVASNPIAGSSVQCALDLLSALPIDGVTLEYIDAR